MRPGLLVASCALVAGCSCQPPQPNVNPPDSPTETGTPPTETAATDTAPSGPCPAPEVEPNDSTGTATPLPMERFGCGAWTQPGDLDYFVFELDEDGWVEVRVIATPIGSVADAHLVITAEDGSAASRTDDEDETDASLVFPGDPQRYHVQLVEENGQGDDERYHYEVIASVVKPPLEWSRMELEPNDGSATAELLASGDVVFGDMDATAEGDWYTVAVGPGKHTVTFDLDAYEHGSAGDFSLVLYDGALNPLPLGCEDAGCIVEGPPTGFAHDPLLEWDSEGNEILYLRVFEDLGKSGDPVWYTLGVTVEG